MDKYLSVITNFGCHYACPYCIVKNNNLQIPKSTLEGIDSLADEIKRNKFFDIVNALRVKIELHTSIPNLSNVPYNRFNRVVYHLHSLKQLRSIKRIGNEIIRVVFVVTKDFTEDLINKIAVYCYNSDNIDELSFRQMVDDHYQATDYCRDYLRSGHQKLWWYIEQNDYNLYYCENKVYTEYRKIGETV